MELQEDTTSIKREFERETTSLAELYQKFQRKDIDYKIYLVRENPYGTDEVFEMVGVLGSGRSCYVFLALIEKKLVSLRMSYEKTDFKNKFDSVRVQMEDDYDESFLNILYPSIPVDYLSLGSVLKKNKLYFDEKVYTSFWEKADATLSMKMNARIDKKLKWFKQCLKGLRIIHSRGRAHFDIKLGNLFLVGNRLKIGDFEYYLKIQDFIRSNIFYCGTPGHMAPEMFYDKENLTEGIDIFSAGVAFARFFTGGEITEGSDAALALEGEAVLSDEEKNQFTRLFKKDIAPQLPSEKIRNAFKNNFKIFNFYRNYLHKELENPELHDQIRAVYPILLDMMSVDPAARPDANMIIRQLDDILGGSENQLKVNGKGIKPPVFKISRTPITVVNLNKKSGIQVGSIKQDKNPGENSVNDINLRFVDISRKHLQLNYIISAPGEEKIEICDLHSKYGVFLNSERLEPGKPREVLTGDIIQLGNIISFRFTGEAGYYLLKNVTAERKKGNLLWLDKKQSGQMPDKQAAIILLTKSVSLAPFGFGENTSLVVDENDDIEVKGWPVKTPVKGDIIL